MIQGGVFSERRHSVDLLEGLDLEYLQVQIGRASRSGSIISMIDDTYVEGDYDISDHYSLYGGSLGIGFAEVRDGEDKGRGRTGSLILSSNLPFVEGNLELDSTWAVQPFSNISFEAVDMDAYQAVALSLEAAKTGGGGRGKGGGKGGELKKKNSKTLGEQRASPNTTSMLKQSTKKAEGGTYPVHASQLAQSLGHQSLSSVNNQQEQSTGHQSLPSEYSTVETGRNYGHGQTKINDQDHSMRNGQAQEYLYEARIDINNLNMGKQNGYIGAYSPEQRKVRIQRFNEKRHRRVWTKKVKYDVRKNFADSRLRVKGRFVKKEDEELMRELKDLSGEDDIEEGQGLGDDLGDNSLLQDGRARDIDISSETYY